MFLVLQFKETKTPQDEINLILGFINCFVFFLLKMFDQQIFNNFFYFKKVVDT